jgi:acetyl-CoA acetyltransferase
LALEERNGFTGPEEVDDVFYGCVNPVDEQAKTIGRLASMVAGWGDDVPGVQLNRMCDSGQQAVNFCAAQVRSGFDDVLIGGGIEHMTRVPMGSNGSWSSITDTYFEYFDELTTQGEAAERIADNGGYDRRTLDEIAVDSQHRCGAAWGAGHYSDHVVPVEAPVDGQS